MLLSISFPQRQKIKLRENNLVCLKSDFCPVHLSHSPSLGACSVPCTWLSCLYLPHCCQSPFWNTDTILFLHKNHQCFYHRMKAGDWSMTSEGLTSVPHVLFNFVYSSSLLLLLLYAWLPLGLWAELSLVPAHFFSKFCSASSISLSSLLFLPSSPIT